MIRRICFILALSVLCLCSCNGGDDSSVFSSAPEEMITAVASTNAETRLAGQYMLEITFGEGNILYSAMGEIAWDREEGIADASIRQSYLGVSGVVRNYFSENKLVSVEGEEAVNVEWEKDEFFSKFPYSPLTEYSNDYGNVTVACNTAGTTYTFYRADGEAVCKTVVGEDLYSLADVIKKPQPEKTEYGTVECIYTVKDGRVVSCRYEFDVKLFDTPAYVPGYSVPESEYTITLHVVARVAYSSFGENVTVAEYSVAK